MAACDTYSKSDDQTIRQSDKLLKIGVVGLGARGIEAVGRLPAVPGAKVVAVCDPAAACRREIPNCAFFYGEDGYKALCQIDLDLVYIATDWAHHVPVALEAMQCGKAAAVEVPAALTLDECWQLVETSEKTGMPCVQLENCIYGEIEMLAENMAREGVFGELVHGENAYIHQLFGPGCAIAEPWRVDWNRVHCGNQYVTHAIGPLARIFGIGKDDEFDFLVSMDSSNLDFAAFLAENNIEGADETGMGDHNATIIRTKKGRTLLLRHDVASVRARARNLHVQGERGVLTDEPFRVAIEPVRDVSELPKIYEIEWQNAQELSQTRKKHMHPLWREFGDVARTADKHGGMDYLMDLRLVQALLAKRPTDTDVYDLASWCALAELSGKSCLKRSAAMEIPSFRRRPA